MPGKAATDGSGSKWTRMEVSADLSFLNIRREHFAHFLHYKKNIHVMKAMAARLGRPITVLDVGCGEANTLRMFWSADTSKKKDVMKTYIGIDGDPVVIAKTEEIVKTPLRGIKGRLEVVDITKGVFPVKPGSVDLVINNEVLEHIPVDGVPKVLRAIRRCLSADGVALISTPNKDGTRDKLPADHVYEHGYQELHDEFKEAGLECQRCVGVYIQKPKLIRYLKEHAPDKVDWAEEIWEKYGNDVGSIMTADWAKPVANNLIHEVRVAEKQEKKSKKKSKK